MAVYKVIQDVEAEDKIVGFLTSEVIDLSSRFMYTINVHKGDEHDHNSNNFR